MMKKFTYLLFNLQTELANHHRSKDEILEVCIKDRLNQSLQSYESTLNDSIRYLSGQKISTVLRRL